MKIGITGKGGVGKSTLSSLLATYGAEKGKEVIAIDADPDMNLSSCLGVQEDFTPLIEMTDLIEERAGGGERGGMIKLNPKVSDIPDKYYVQAGGVKVMVLGTVWGGGTGCTCPENAFLKQLLTHLMLERDGVVIADFEAGIEHLGRGTSEGVDALITVVEPDRRSLKTANRIRELAADIGINEVLPVGNGIKNEKDKDFLTDALAEEPLGFVPYREEIRRSSRQGTKVPLNSKELRYPIEKIWNGLSKRIDQTDKGQRR